MNHVLTPQLTEKNHHLASQLNIYVFKVDPNLNKAQIKTLIAEEHGVSVVDVRTANFSGKKARSIHLSSRSSRVIGRRPRWKKAYVTLKKGESIPVFTDFTKEEKK